LAHYREGRSNRSRHWQATRLRQNIRKSRELRHKNALQRFRSYRIPKPQLPSGFFLQEKATLHDFEKGYINCETALKMHPNRTQSAPKLHCID
jgi:hypothetical protein